MKPARTPLKRAAPKRRSPKQERAKDTIQCILDATAKVLVARGYAKTSTNHIAEKAGISVGSLYQYFKNKESLVHALLVQHCERSESLLSSELEKVGAAPVREIIAHTVRAIIEFNLANHDLCCVFYNELPRDGDFRILSTHFANCAHVIEPFLLAHKDEIRVHDTKLSSYFVVHAVVGTYFGTPKEFRAPANREKFCAEIQDLVITYLTGERSR